MARRYRRNPYASDAMKHMSGLAKDKFVPSAELEDIARSLSDHELNVLRRDVAANPQANSATLRVLASSYPFTVLGSPALPLTIMSGQGDGIVSAALDKVSDGLTRDLNTYIDSYPYAWAKVQEFFVQLSKSLCPGYSGEVARDFNDMAGIWIRELPEKLSSDEVSATCFCLLAHVIGGLSALGFGHGITLLSASNWCVCLKQAETFSIVWDEWLEDFKNKGYFR